MSRVGKKPIPIPDDTKILFKNRVITVQGKNGILERRIHPAVNLKIENGTVSVSIDKDDRISRSLHGLTRSLIANMVSGVNEKFERRLEINGIGYRAAMQDNSIILNLGYSHPIHFDLPDGISASVEKNNVIKLFSIDKEKLGLVSATIRRLRPPEPYKGKGIKYAEERIQRKAGKTGTK
ncbi:MAG: 50S ribosomal protein L6 [Thermodesulfobacteriota bacterium]|nr:50S ribosomal protein L6 [Thermodesulfobacteriota bacterium]